MTTTPDPRDEWLQLHVRMQQLATWRERAESLAVGYLREHVAEHGVPDDDGSALHEACKNAASASAIWAEWEALYAEAQAHPYTAVVAARAAS